MWTNWDTGIVLVLLSFFLGFLSIGWDYPERTSSPAILVRISAGAILIVGVCYLLLDLTGG